MERGKVEGHVLYASATHQLTRHTLCTGNGVLSLGHCHHGFQGGSPQRWLQRKDDWWLSGGHGGRCLSPDTKRDCKPYVLEG